MAYSQLDVDGIDGKILTGVDETRDRDQSVKFRSLAELKTIKADAEADVAAAAGTPHRRFRRVVPMVGL